MMIRFGSIKCKTLKALYASLISFNFIQLALGALRTKDGESEGKLYQHIVNIPHYNTKYLSLLDKEDEAEVVADNFTHF